MTPAQEKMMVLFFEQMTRIYEAMASDVRELRHRFDEHEKVCHGNDKPCPPTTASVPPRAPQNSSVSLHVPGGSVALREMSPGVLVAFILALAVMGGAGWALGHNVLHAAQAAPEIRP
jgi:hypothetical protein